MTHTYKKWLLTFLTVFGLTFISNAQIIQEDFESGSFPSDWALFNNGTGPDWDVLDATTEQEYQANGTYCMSYRNGYNSYTADSWAITGAVALAAGTVIEIDFDYQSQSSSSPEAMKVTVGNSQTPSAQTNVLWDNNNIVWESDPQNMQHAHITYTAPSNGNYYFAWNCYSNDQSWGLFVDDIVITLPRPWNLSVDNITSTSADLNWSAGSSETSWNVEYDTDGFSLGSGTQQTVSATTLNISNLSPNTDYEFYVQSNYANGNTSAWTGPFAFTTECSTITSFPYTVDYSDNNILDCWSANGGWDYGYDYAGYYPTMSENNEYLISPQIELTGNQELSYNFANNGVTLQILLSTTGKNPNDFTETLLELTGNGEGWIDLSAYSGSVYIAYHISSNGGGNSYLYPFTIKDIPTCTIPSNLNITPESNTATASWTSGGASNWDIAYGLPGFDVNTAAIHSVSGTATYTITGLNVGTDYEVYVRDNCGNGDVSEWVGPVSFTTTCNATVSQFPYYENFENTAGGEQAGVDIPSCWNEQPLVGGAAWRAKANGYDTGDNLFKCMAFDCNLYATNAGDKSRLETVKFDFSQESNLHLKFMWYAPHVQEFKIVLSTDGGNTFPINLQTASLPATSYQQMDIDLSNYCGNGYNNVVIGFEGTSTGEYSNSSSNYYYIFIDEVRIEDPDYFGCWYPSNISASNITNNSATISWTTGGSDNWDIAYGQAGFDVNTTNPYAVSGSPSYNLNNLTPNTTYDVYVRDVCGIGDNGEWTGPYQFTTTGNPTGINYVENVILNVYPNPNNGEFTISANLNSQEDFTISIISINGQTIYEDSFNAVSSIQENISLKAFAKGVYYVKLTNDNFIKQQKIVIY